MVTMLEFMVQDGLKHPWVYSKETSHVSQPISLTYDCKLATD